MQNVLLQILSGENCFKIVQEMIRGGDVFSIINAYLIVSIS